MNQILGGQPYKVQFVNKKMNSRKINIILKEEVDSINRLKKIAELISPPYLNDIYYNLNITDSEEIMQILEILFNQKIKPIKNLSQQINNGSDVFLMELNPLQNGKHKWFYYESENGWQVRVHDDNGKNIKSYGEDSDGYWEENYDDNFQYRFESTLKNIVKRVIKESLTEKKLITESIEGKRCWYYNKIADGSYIELGLPNPYEGAGEVQEFLIEIGYKIDKDWDFGDITAKALGIWAYGNKIGINTVDELWSKMKKDGWDVGQTSGYGPKMLKSVADLIVKKCKVYIKYCKIDQQTLFDMEFKTLPESEVACRNNLDKSFKKAVKYWENYLSTDEFRDRIINKNQYVDKRDEFSKIVDNVINFFSGGDGPDVYDIDILVKHYKYTLKNIKGWKFVSGVNYNMESSNPISVNRDRYCDKYSYEKAYYSFVHEIQHILNNLELNDVKEIKKAYPLATDHYANKKGSTKMELGKKQIPLDSKNELIKNNVDYIKLTNWASDPRWVSTYWCDQNEKLSNLHNFRAYLSEKGEIKEGGDMGISIFTKYLKKYLDNPNDKDLSYTTNFEELIVCWAQNNFTPKLSKFIAELDSLAKSERDTTINSDDVISKVPVT